MDLEKIRLLLCEPEKFEEAKKAGTDIVDQMIYRKNCIR